VNADQIYYVNTAYPQGAIIYFANYRLTVQESYDEVIQLLGAQGATLSSFAWNVEPVEHKEPQDG
jgi:hypothetical protein